MSIESKIITASKWSILAEIISKAITPIVFLILARILAPDDFGIVAVPTIMISFSQIFWDAGLGKSLIQIQKNINASANIVFWTNATLGIVIYLILFFAADLVAGLFGDIRIKSVIQIQGIQIIIASLSSVQTALHQRELNFKSLFYVQLFTVAVPAILSIPLALAGLRYWALVAGTLVGSTIRLFFLWKLSNWRPSFSYDLRRAKEMLGFSLWIAGESFLAWFYLWIDSVIVGAYMTSGDLGLYRTGDLFVNSVFGICVAPLAPVLYSSFSKLRSQNQILNTAIANWTIIVSMISITLGTALYLMRNLLESVIFSAQWSGVASVIGVFGLLHGLTWINGPQIAAFRAIGRPDINTKIMLLGMFYSVPIFLFSIRFGIEVFVWIRLATITITFTIRLILASKFFKISWIDYLKKMRFFFLVLAAVSSATLVLEGVFNNVVIEPVRLVLTFFISFSIYAIFFLNQKEKIRNLINFQSLV